MTYGPPLQNKFSLNIKLQFLPQFHALHNVKYCLIKRVRVKILKVTFTQKRTDSLSHFPVQVWSGNEILCWPTFSPSPPLPLCWCTGDQWSRSSGNKSRSISWIGHDRRSSTRLHDLRPSGTLLQIEPTSSICLASVRPAQFSTCLKLKMGRCRSSSEFREFDCLFEFDVHLCVSSRPECVFVRHLIL